MYLSWAAQRRFEAEVVDEMVAPGRSSLLHLRLHIHGHGAFALLRRESGLHRLVEAAPDGGRAIRHARVAVWPHVDEEAWPLPLSDLHLQGTSVRERGHFLKKLRSHVTATHRPSQRSIECMSEGALHETEERVLALLRGWLVTEHHALTPPMGEPPWGDVVRTYHRHREQGVRDHRTDLVTGSIQRILGGHIDPFLLAALRARGEGT